jgi:hypothetical protein
MIATLSALVLGLLVGSAKSSFDTTNTAFIQNGAKVILLDRILAAYGPEAKGVREQLRRGVVATMETFWPEERTGGSVVTAFERANAGLIKGVARLHDNDAQRKYSAGRANR